MIGLIPSVRSASTSAVADPVGWVAEGRRPALAQIQDATALLGSQKDAKDAKFLLLSNCDDDRFFVVLSYAKNLGR